MNVPLNINLQQILLHLFNFAILAFGLYFLLYKPVKDFMAKREAHYAEMDAEAENHLSSAKEQEELYRARMASAEADAAEIRRAAEAEAAEAALRARRESEAEARAILDSARTEALRQKENILSSAREEVSELAISAVKKIMDESLSDSYDSFLSLAEGDAAHE